LLPWSAIRLHRISRDVASDREDHDEVGLAVSDRDGFAPFPDGSDLPIRSATRTGSSATQRSNVVPDTHDTAESLIRTIVMLLLSQRLL
jgi:hypothetical protein